MCRLIAGTIAGTIVKGRSDEEVSNLDPDEDDQDVVWILSLICADNILTIILQDELEDFDQLYVTYLYL